MPDNDFWKRSEITQESIAFETDVYLVVVTPKLWRHLARTEGDRHLGEFSIVSKLYGTVESSAQNLPLAITTAKSLQESYDAFVVTDKGVYKNDCTIIPFGKNRPE